MAHRSRHATQIGKPWLAGEIEARAAALDQLRADLAHLDAAIRIMCPDAEPELIRPRKPSRKGCDWFGRQELPRLVLVALGAAGSPCRAPRLRSSVMARRACRWMPWRYGSVAGMVKGALHRRDGGVVERVGNGRDVRWRISVDGPPEAA